MCIYTRYGDGGSTKGFDGEDLCKDEPRVEALGALDELNSYLGLCLCGARDAAFAPIRSALEPLQSELFAIGAVLVSTGTGQPLPLQIESTAIDRMEGQIDRAWQKAGRLDRFILPAGGELACRLHVARSVCRRAERRCVGFARTVSLEAMALKYLNRLSDLLFALARLANALAQAPEVTWQSPGDSKT
jgi:cob(I)alamin adenosyltransferase